MTTQVPSKKLVDEMVDIAEALRTTNAPRGNQLASLSHRVRSEFQRLHALLELETGALEQACAAPVDAPLTVQQARAAHEPSARHPNCRCNDGYECDRCADARIAKSITKPPPVSPWIKVTHRLPESGVPVLAFVTNESGKTRRIRAQWCAKFTEESDGDDAEYCEEKDTYYSPEGWYESNEYDEVNWFVHDPVSHWMPLPEGPTATKGGDAP